MVVENWVDSPEYVAAVEQWVERLRGTRFYEPVRFAMTDTTRFDYFIDGLRPYTSYEGKRILDSGCGTGGLCIRLLRDRPEHVTA